MRRAYYSAVVLSVTLSLTSGCARRVEMQEATQTSETTITEPNEETLPHHFANPSIRRDERGHMTGLFDATSYVEDEKLCTVKQKVLKFLAVRKEGTVIDFVFEMPSTAYLFMRLGDRLQKMYEAEKKVFDRFLTKGKNFD